MAIELQQLPNPDNVPGAVTSGYQRQNTNLFILQKPNINTCYWIAINTDNEGTATCSLVTRPGIWDSSKKGCYTADNKRTLNWVSLGQTSTSDLTLTKALTTKGIHTWRGKTGWYYIILKSGLGGGNGGNGSGLNYGGGGVPNQYKMKQFPYFSDGFYTNTIKIGGNGYNGGRGGYGGRQDFFYAGSGGGGGSGSGENSTFNDIDTGVQFGGNGGNGGNGNRDASLDRYYNGSGGWRCYRRFWI